jgi:hypothetical protein
VAPQIFQQVQGTWERVAGRIAYCQRKGRLDGSWNIGRMCHFKNYLVRALRNAVLKKALSSGGEKQIKKLYSIA